jgi:hypothetical protein
VFTDYIENTLVVISIKNMIWGGIIIIRLDIETWVIGQGGTKEEVMRKGMGV